MCSVASLGSELLELQKLQDTEWTMVGAGKGNAWEVGATHTGVVSYWNQGAGWGKIKVCTRTAEPSLIGYLSMFIHSQYWGRLLAVGCCTQRMDGATKLHPKRPARRGWNNEIFVHNTQLPMDAKRRWLKRGEQVQVRYGQTPESR